ncbi:MAG: phosphoribosylglycinamide formyltransferase [Candidatus Omnitrophota bacterium]|nr:phosphoribosylglycinamide formyltransferase [Candidatus Omnitrophota bacterium]
MKFAVFASGHGSNLQAIIDAVKAGTITGELALVVSNNRKAHALKRAQDAGIKILFLNPQDYATPTSYDRELTIHLKQENIDFIVLAGYLRLVSAFFVKTYARKILNIHPSLLPSFKGLDGIKDAFTYGAKVTGATVHFVDEKMDHGPIILQDAIKIAENDTLETLSEKIHKIEHRIYPKAIQLFVEGRLTIKGRRVEIVEKP